MKSLAAPATVLLAAGMAWASGPALPASVAGLKLYGPYLVLGLGAAISLWFNRGRAFVGLASLLLAYAAWRWTPDTDSTGFAARAVFTAITLFLPLNFLLATLLPERGVFHYRNYRWLLLAAMEIALAVWVAAAGQNPLSGMAWQAALDHWVLRAAPVPPLGLLLMAAALGTAAFRAWPRCSPLEVGMTAALVPVFVACQWWNAPGVPGVFLSAAGAMLLVAVLQESHRMAFRDELTGLPGRRALDEALRALGPAYAIAMVDVDHFKKFNDTHGHHVGDEVLRLVAARLAEVGGGGRAYRYGGEEFCVLFPQRGVKEALPHMEQLRQTIEGYQMVIRGSDRPKDPETGRGRRGVHGLEQTVSVTVSIGVAERSDWLPTGDEVVRGADEALYRAKNRGRNRVVSR
ncbi:MAG TPA: GGDEF domain-containing protein [Burkholderiales bacterium]|nr:GGDEF domain-containing protein [Burkholderiales bacterium]